jgi:hypothetical protein
MRSVKTLLLLSLCALLLALAAPAFAVEGDSFAIYGTVTDANWNPVPGALVTLFDNDMNQIITQNTDRNGNFSFENMVVKTSLCTVHVTYIDAGGVRHDIPSYYIKRYWAKDVQQVDPRESHYDDYYLPGSMPRVTPTAEPTATALPTAVPSPTPDPGNGLMTNILVFIGGSVAGAAVATLACFMVLRPKKK